MKHLILIAALFAGFMALLSSQNVAVSASADVCPEGGDWVKKESLSGLTYTFTEIPDGYEVTENCYKASTTVVYGSGVSVQSTVFNSPGKPPAVCTAPGVPDNGCSLQELSHASFKLVKKEVPTITVCLDGENERTIPRTTDAWNRVLYSYPEAKVGVCPTPKEPTSTIRWCFPTENGHEARAIPSTDPTPEVGKPWQAGMNRSCEFDNGTGGPESTPTPTPESTPTPTPEAKKDPKHTALGYEVRCEWNHVLVTFDVKENDDPIKDREVTFKYDRRESKTRTNDEGRAVVSFDLASENVAVYAEIDDYPDQSQLVELPGCPGVGGQVLGISTFADTSAVNHLGSLASVMMIAVGGYLTRLNLNRD